MEEQLSGSAEAGQTHSFFQLFLLRVGLFVFVLGGLTSGMLTFSQLTGWGGGSSKFGSGLLPLPLLPVDPIGSPDWSNKERVNILFLGIDRRPSEALNDATRTDTMLLVTLDPYSKTAGMLSIPRDLWIPIPYASNRVIHDRINTAHVYGMLYDYPGGGTALAKDTVQYNLGVRVHYYVMLDFQGFQRLVDSVDGITVELPRPLIDHEYPTDDYEIRSIYIPEGVQHLDGEKTLWYVRSRHSDSDFGRMRRQQQVLLAMRERLMQLGSIPKLPLLWGQFNDAVQTDLSLPELLSLASIAREVKPEDIAGYALEAGYVTPTFTLDGASILLPNRSNMGKLIAEVFFDPRKEQEAAYIEILNGTETTGLASRAAQQLQKSGFLHVSIGDADGGPYTKTEIQNLSGKAYTANLLASFLRLPRDRIKEVNKFNGESVDIRIILGQDAAQLIPLQ